MNGSLIFHLKLNRNLTNSFMLKIDTLSRTSEPAMGINQSIKDRTAWVWSNKMVLSLHCLKWTVSALHSRGRGIFTFVHPQCTFCTVLCQHLVLYQAWQTQRCLNWHVIDISVTCALNLYTASLQLCWYHSTAVSSHWLFCSQPQWSVNISLKNQVICGFAVFFLSKDRRWRLWVLNSHHDC